MSDQNPQYEPPKILHDAPLRESDKADFHFDKFALTLVRLTAAGFGSIGVFECCPQTPERVGRRFRQRIYAEM